MGTAGGSDVLVIGAGVFGLSVALACARRGLRVTVLEAGRPGEGASGGLVGALAPFAPEPWTETKAFQLRALLGAGAYWAGVAADGGVDAGYARPGRLIPLASDGARSRAERLAGAARDRWPETMSWRLVPADHLPDWLDPTAAPQGAVLETLAGRIAPRQAIAALGAALTARGGVLRTGCIVQRVADGRVLLDDGWLSAGAVVVAAGTGSAALLAEFVGPAAVSGVKGQAALLAAPGCRGLPVIAGGGLYVVPQGDGTVAVGSTSERDFDDPLATDAGLEAVIGRARGLCPALAEAPVVARWAGVRPRAPRPDPMIGRLPGCDRVFVATGGFKIGFALAPEIGRILAGMIAGDPVVLPPGFAPADHLPGGIRR